VLPFFKCTANHCDNPFHTFEVGVSGFRLSSLILGSRSNQFQWVPTQSNCFKPFAGSQWKPVVPDTFWDFLTEYTYHAPNGWIFTGVGMENLPGLETTWLVRERYEYVYDKSL
jgi:hypothetical protein